MVDSKIHSGISLNGGGKSNLGTTIVELLNIWYPIFQLNPVKKERKVPVPVYDHPITDHKHSDLHRLQDRLDREIRERRERRLKKKAEKESYQPRDDSYPKEQYSAGDNYDLKRVSFQVDDKAIGLQTKQQNREDKKALRSSVIKSLLRTYNDLNCEAKDECKDECSERRIKKKECVNKCEKQFQCEEKKEEEDKECNEGNDTCEQDEDNPSTRGVPFEPEPTEKCKRC